MSSNRLSYDECAYKTNLKQSTDPLEYMMYQGKYNNDSKCRFEFGLLGGNGVSIYSGNLVDLESDLRGQTRVLSDCPDKMFNPSYDKELSQNLINQRSCKLDYYNNMKPFIEQFPIGFVSNAGLLDLSKVIGAYERLHPSNNINERFISKNESVKKQKVADLMRKIDQQKNKSIFSILNEFYEPFYKGIIAASNNMNNSIEAVKEAKTLKPNEIINKNIFILTSAEYAAGIVEAVIYKTNYKPTKDKMTNIDIIEEGIKAAKEVKEKASNAIKVTGGIGAIANKKIDLDAEDAKLYNDGDRAGVYAGGIVIADMFINKLKEKINAIDIQKLFEVDVLIFLYALIIISNSMAYIDGYGTDENKPPSNESRKLFINNFNKLGESKNFEDFLKKIADKKIQKNYKNATNIMHYTSAIAFLFTILPKNNNEIHICNINEYNDYIKKCDSHSAVIYICNFYNILKTNKDVRDKILPLVSSHTGWGRGKNNDAGLIINKNQEKNFKNTFKDKSCKEFEKMYAF